MAAEKTFNRWLVVVGAMLIQVSLGAVYIYSVFKPSLSAKFPSWSPTDLALPSQLILAFFALGVIFAGKIQDKIGPRIVASVGGVMLGASRSGRGEDLREFEFLRLHGGADGGVSYLAQPGGGAPVAFRLVRHDAASAIFENPAHDYPQRITYAREGDTLTATISLIDGSNARRWVYTRR